ncbi:MAG: hypothetical protein KKA31_05230 [Candidatus Margulisbacteria bacterium]|nr:hypothetical protein [Candidatus Margulisiibacteriota bacterium]
MEALIEAVNQASSSIFPLLGNVLLALILLLIGFLVARGLALLTTLVLKAVQLDKGAKQIGFNSLLETGNVKISASELIGELVYWVIVLVVFISVAGAFGLAVEPVVAKIFNYLGLVLLASLILGIGLFFASLIAAVIRVIMLNLGIAGAKTASRFIYYIVVIFTFLAVLAELGLNPELFIQQMGVFVGAVGLAAAIAFGLGCKDMAADFLHNLFKGK